MDGLNTEVYVHPTALVHGDTVIGEGSSIWPYAVIRAEVNRVLIGRYSNIQDFVMLHVGERTDTVIGDYCSVAHRAVIHGATIGDNTLVGVGAIVMDGCVVGKNCIIGAASYLPPGTVIPDNSIVSGHPAVVIRTRDNLLANRMNAVAYNINAAHYRRGLHRAWSDPEVRQQIKASSRQARAMSHT